MAQKRKAQEAFGKPKGQLSAFAAARLAKQLKAIPAEQLPEDTDEQASAFDIAETPYHGGCFDSESDEDGPVDILVGEQPKPTSSATLSSFGTTARVPPNTADDASLEIELNVGESATFVGVYDLRVVKGVVTIYGATLHPGSASQRVYSPSINALPPITARRDSTVVRVVSARSSLQKLENLSPLFRNIWAGRGETKRSFALLRTTTDDTLQRSLQRLELDSKTESLLSGLASEPVSKNACIVAIGAKSSGKSTLNRMLCNTFITRPDAQRVLYLDLDPGQPEFGPPGQLSLVEVTAPLLGPAFTHPAARNASRYRLVRSHTIAATTFKDDPEHYMACVRDLAQHAERRNCPLIVNSCGWTSGLGADVLVDLCAILRTTDLVVLVPVEELLVTSLQSACVDARLHRIPRQPSRPSARTPAEFRNMQTMAYFHSGIEYSGEDEEYLRWSSRPMSAIRPWIVGYDGADAGIAAIVSCGQAPSPEFLAEVLEGSLVALVVLDQDNENEALRLGEYEPQLPTVQSDEDSVAKPSSIEQQIFRTAERLPYLQANSLGVSLPLHPGYSECMTLALVRAIDKESKTFHLITPLPGREIAALMQKKVVLVRGGFDPPVWAYLEDLYNAGNEGAEAEVDRPWVSKREPLGVEGAIWRIRHPPMAAAVMGKQ